MSKLIAYSKLLRLPGLGGLAVPPVFGALSVGVTDLYSLSILFVIGVFTALFGFVLNDYADVELDGLVPELKGKPLVSGDIHKKNAVAICIISILLTFLFVFLLWRRTTLDELKFAAFLSIFLAGFLGTIYDLYGKKIVGSDFLVAISMAFVFLFGALSFKCPTLLTWVIFLLTFNQTLYMNAVSGGIKDSDHDFKMGVKNIALSSGVKVKGGNIFIPLHFKTFGMGIRLFSACLVFIPFALNGFDFEIWHIILLGLFVVVVLYLSAKLLNIRTFDRKLIRKLISSQELLRYYLVPVMLIPFIGLLTAFILIVIPFLWYVFFTSIMGEKLYQPGRWL